LPGTRTPVIVKVSVFEVPPPGAGFVTLIGAVPCVATRVAGTVALSWVALPKVVVMAVPPKLMTELLRKFVPVTVRVKALAPAFVLEGCKALRVGVGLLGAVIVKFRTFDEPPPGVGFVTVTGAVPCMVTKDAGTVALSCVGLRYVVGRALPPKLMVAPATKFVPVTVRVNPTEPAAMLDGCSELSVGSGLLDGVLIVNVRAFDVPPPGAALMTVIDAVPALATSLARMATVSWVELR
jgi:hypothetical protein